MRARTRSAAAAFAVAVVVVVVDVAGVAASDERADAMALWQRGIHAAPREASTRAQYARYARLALPVLRHRGGASACGEAGCEVAGVDYGALTRELGPGFAAALAANEAEHAADCARSCEKFYCANETGAPSAWATRSISMGSVPPEDFASEFKFPLDLIKVTEEPLFSRREAARAIELARAERVDLNEYTSGKYKLGGDWLAKMDATRAWFNAQLEATIFPALAASFPEVVSSKAALRAHSVAMLKYNATHPRTDVHIDNGILALTLALSPADAYVGGGTFFEHLGEDALVEMDAGHATWRPGSVRHGGHRVTKGERYIIGAFLLLSDRVEHVRRTKNRGAELRSSGDVRGALDHFKWALAINPRCATCLKDLSEAHGALADSAKAPRDRAAHLADAEAALRGALDLLPSDSDALFSLGVLLSKKGDADGALKAYEASADVNADDVELLYNLAVKLGEAGRKADEANMYERALKADPTFSRARCNLGANLAEQGRLDEAEVHFRAAATHDAFSPTPWQNLAVLYHKRGVDAFGGLATAQSKDQAARTAASFPPPRASHRRRSSPPAQVAIANAAEAALVLADEAWRKVLAFLSDAAEKSDTIKRLSTVVQLRGRAAAVVEPSGALPHFLEATKLLPTDRGAWHTLAKVHDILGDKAAAAKAAAKANVLATLSGQA